MIPTAVEISVTTANQWVGLIASLLAMAGALVATIRKILQLQMQVAQSEEAVNALRKSIEEMERRSDEDMSHVATAITDLTTQIVTTLAIQHPEHKHQIRIPRFQRMRIDADR